MLLPQGIAALNTHADLMGKIVELPDDVVAQLSTLGAPLTAQVYSNCYRSGASMPAFALDVRDGRGSLRGQATDASGPPLRQRTITFATEFCFADDSDGIPVCFDDDAYIEWLLPEVKDSVFARGNVVFPDRWAGRVCGFNGPLYLYKSGPVEMTITPEGWVSTCVQADLSHGTAQTIDLLHQFTRRAQARMVAAATDKLGHHVRPRFSYMTDLGWQFSLGRLSSDPGSAHLAGRDAGLRETRRHIRSVRTPDPSTLLGPIRELFCAPVAEDVEPWLRKFDELKHNRDLMPLTERVFSALDCPNWSLHDKSDEGLDVLVYASSESNTSVCVQVKSHEEMLVDSSDFYATVMSQRAHAASYGASLYLLLLFGNELSDKPHGKRDQGTEGRTVRYRWTELKRRFARSPDFRANTEVVSPENLAQALSLTLGQPE